MSLPDDARLRAFRRHSRDAPRDDGEPHPAPRGIAGAPLMLDRGHRGGDDERMR